MPFPTRLHDFKEWLAQPQVQLELIRHPFNHPALNKPRRIRSVSNVDFTFADGFLAGFRSAQAWTFDGDLATLTLSSSTLHDPKPRIIQYRMHH
jgi:hypothetical protein